MSRKYAPQLLNAMQKSQYTADVMGVPVLVKPIPEGGAPGDMDPRLYRTTRIAPLILKLVNLKKPKPGPVDTAPIRSMFGKYKGRYIANDGVETRRLTVPSADGHPVPVRVYTRSRHGEHLPVLVYFHGGGFLGGSPDVVEQMCKLLVQKRDCVVFNVDYRLAPQYHYPQPLDDCWAVTRWAAEHSGRFGGDGRRLAVSGDSAGGNLAAAVTLRARDEGLDLVKLQALIYPSVNLSGRNTQFYHGVDSEKYQYSKRHEKAARAMLALMSKMLVGGSAGTTMLEEVYLQGHIAPEHPYASPLLANPKGLPPTLLLFGEHDFLAFEDFAYARTLHKGGVPLKTVVYRGLGHGFADQIGVFPQVEDCIEEIAGQMSALFLEKEEVNI